MRRFSAHRVLPACALSLVATLAPLTAAATCTSFESQMLEGVGVSFGGFGRAVAIEGDRAVVTADGEAAMGAAYVFERLGDVWAPAQRLQQSDPEALDLFGAAMALEGDTLLIGNPYDDDAGGESGSVYVFEHDGNGWVEVQKLVASDGQAADRFGWAIAMAGDLAVIGAINDDDGGSNTGAAYVFRHDGVQWVEEQKLAASNPSASDELGFRVATDGTHVVATAVNDDDMGSDAGAVYVFSHDGAQWVEAQKLVAADGAAGDWFGWSLAIDAGRLAIGATQHDMPMTNAGAVYLHDWDGVAWGAVDKLGPSDPLEYGTFGWSIALQGERMAIGAPGTDDFGGGVYVLQNTDGDWVESHRWLGSGAPGAGFFDDNLGLSVALDGDRVLSGAPFADGGGANDAGATYAYDLSDLALQASPDPVGVGETLTVEVCGGIVGEPAHILLRSVQGNPRRFILDTGVFDASGRFSTSVVVPPGAAGKQATFQGFGVWAPGVRGFSNTADIQTLPLTCGMHWTPFDDRDAVGADPYDVSRRACQLADELRCLAVRELAGRHVGPGRRAGERLRAVATAVSALAAEVEARAAGK